MFHVRDRDGNPAIVGLYLDDDSLYDPKHYVVGNTICIMYAKRKQFADGTWGIRVENGKNMQGTEVDNHAHNSVAMYMARIT